MVQWINGFIIPTIEVIAIGGVVGFASFFVGKALHNVWSKSIKFILKYKVRKKEYPAKTIKWIFDCIEQGIGWHDAKKLMMVSMLPTNQMNETLWIYDQIIIELNKESKKGGNTNGREYKRSNSKDESTTELPTIKTC